MNRIDEINAKQRAVYNAHARAVEVETRERGWSAKELADAEVDLMEAIGAYESAYDCKPEYQPEKDRLGFRYPLTTATTARIMQICGESN
jgi:hypothetical protein